MKDKPTKEAPDRPMHPVITLLLVLLCVAIGAMIYVETKRRAWRYDLEQTLQALMFSETTEFAPEFTEAGFDQLEIGQSREEVVELLGRPYSRDWLESTTTGTHLVDFKVEHFDPLSLDPRRLTDPRQVLIESWSYTRSTKGKNHHDRSVSFDARGLVDHFNRGVSIYMYP